ncbi:hypothetical protein DY000_02041771 [Brassica cretica]|uniref:Cullin N-terminal domain-containing protein n=1 Tax=Brassica cretica TaxID=69181 RepID=A0ABQ7BLH1_BRACR|nr:hypothetical protein DY000_02041771 [Brassica cretica]
MAKWKKSAGVNSRDNISRLSNSLEAEIALLDPDANRMKQQIKNRVLMLLDEDGVEHYLEGAKGHIATEYFRDLFMSSYPHDLDSLFEGFHGRVSEEMNGSLVSTEGFLKR